MVETKLIEELELKVSEDAKELLTLGEAMEREYIDLACVVDRLDIDKARLEAAWSRFFLEYRFALLKAISTNK